MDGKCPGCHEDVPLVLRGVVAYCAACGTPRPALGRKVLGVSGKPAKYGGIAAKILAGSILGLGTFVALLITFVIQAIWPEGMLGYAIGLPIEFLTTLLAGALYFGGRMLGKAGDRVISETRLKALRALARQRKGILRATDVADALHMPEREADELLTALAQKADEDVGIDVNDEGEVLYLIGSPEAKRFRMRVEAAGLGEQIPEEIPAELDAELERMREAD